MTTTTLLFIVLIVSLVSSIIGLRLWIRKCRKNGLLWEDINKFGQPKNVASSGGIVVVLSFTLGVLFYISIRTFLFSSLSSNVEIFALLSSVLLVSIVGLIDDLLGWHKGGMSMKIRLILAAVAAIPLMVINAGESSVSLPFFGTINFGILYPLILIPIGIVATTTVYNFLAGFNGLEAGQGILILTFLSYVSYISGSSWLSIVGLCMVFSLIGFWFFNRSPALVFPGDILTYSVGALIGGMAIVGNFEKIALIVFIPYIIEMILKVRGKIHLGEFPSSFGIPQRDGSLKERYNKIYGLTHFSLSLLGRFKKKVYETDVVYFIYLIQIVFILIALSIM